MDNEIRIEKDIIGLEFFGCEKMMIFILFIFDNEV